MNYMEKKNKLYLFIGLLISVIGVLISILLVCKHAFPDICTSSLGCSVEGVDGCKELGQTSYSKIFGIPIAFLGLIYYSFIMLLFLYNLINIYKNKTLISHHILLLYYSAIFGLIFDGALAYINFTSLIVPCLLCVYTYFVTLGLFFIILILKNRNKPNLELKPFMQSFLIFLGVSIILSSFITGVYYGFSQTKSTVLSKDSLLPISKVEEYYNDFLALKTFSLKQENLKTYEGDPTGYIVIHKFADFLCPHCLHTSYILKKALERWPGRIVVYYRQFPLDSTCNKEISSPPRKPYGDWRCNGALAAVCAGQYPNFAEFYHLIFDLQNQQMPIDLEQLERISKIANIPWVQLWNCMKSPLAQNLIDRDVYDAKVLDLHSTPTVFLNNKLVSIGTPDETYFLHLLDAIVYKKEGKSAYEEFKNRKKMEK